MTQDREQKPGEGGEDGAAAGQPTARDAGASSELDSDAGPDAATLPGGDSLADPGAAQPVQQGTRPDSGPEEPDEETDLDDDRAPRERVRIDTGTVLFGEYAVEGLLGEGGMGEVYRARHRRLDETRAIKVMQPALHRSKAWTELFDREAKALLSIRHPAVVHCHDLLSDAEGRVYLVMELVGGTPLSELIARAPLRPAQVRALTARIASGLAAAHAQGVVHRDLSPENIVLPDGRPEEAKIIDFGIAKMLEAGQATLLEGFKGKLSYASPEQLGFFEGRIDWRSDYYSLGLTLCAAAMGRTLDMGRTYAQAVEARRTFTGVPSRVPAELHPLIAPLLALDPADRPASLETLLATASDAIAETPTAVAPQGRGRGARWALPAGAAALAAGAAAALLLSRGAPAPPAVQPGPAQADLTRPEPPATAPPRTEAQPVRTPVKPKPAQTAAARAEALRRELRIEGLLRGAEAALQEDHLTSPRGANAYQKFKAVLALDAGNQAAKEGLAKVGGRYLEFASASIASGDIDRAEEMLAKAREVAPRHPRLEATRAALDQSKAERGQPAASP
jgi:serine/threonine-protein kinase